MRRSLGRLALIGLTVGLTAAGVVAVPAGAVPRPPHIMVILMENHGAGSIIGNGQAPFENSLARHYVTLTNWTGVDHPSAPNYVALATGQDNGQAGKLDCTPTYPNVTPCDYTGNNLGVQLASAGIPAAWFVEGLRGNGCSIANAQSGNGDVNHEPWAYLPVWQANTTACGEAGLRTVAPHDVQVIHALQSRHPPDFVWITPNLLDDTHNGTIPRGDDYLQGLLTAVRHTSWYRSGGTIVVTYDEDEGEANPPGYCTHPIVLSAVGAHCVATFVVSAADAGVGKVARPGDHFGLLRSIEEAYGLPLLNNAGTPKFGDIERYLTGHPHR